MSTRASKNYLRMCRRRLGLGQRHLAVILNLSAPSRVSKLEAGTGLPTIRECVAFCLVFNRSIGELWPNLSDEVESAVEASLQALLVELQRESLRSERKRTRSIVLRGNLQALIDNLAERDVPENI
jgi:DNA-binding XRE family transcriptional regulator